MSLNKQFLLLLSSSAAPFSSGLRYLTPVPTVYVLHSQKDIHLCFSLNVLLLYLLHLDLQSIWN